MSDYDPFASACAELTWRDQPLYTSHSHYHLAMAMVQSYSLAADAADLAVLWVMLIPPADVMTVEAGIRRTPDDLYGRFFRWIDEAKVPPHSKEMREVKELVREFTAQVSASQSEIDPDSIDSDGEGMPGKSQPEPDTPPE